MTKQYGRYVLDERIAMGGMAEIFRAHTAQSGFEKRVCIKRILPHFLEQDTLEGGEFVTMFRDEAKTAAKLQHANVVQVFDFGEHDGTLYLAMELIDGADLRRIMDQSRKKHIPLELGECVQIAIDVCRGLHHAHTLVENGRALGVVHRDISPHNILVSRAGEVKVTDFGIARAAERATHTSTGIVKGKVAYMSPEQAQGLDFDHRLDQFALGVVLWELLCGIRLFTGENDAQILKKVLDCDVPPPSSIRSDVPAALDDVVLKALSASPRDRFGDMRQMELALSKFLYSGAIDPATADVRNVFTRVMTDSQKNELRKTQVADAAEVAAKIKTLEEDLDHASSTESAPRQSGSDVSMVFTSSEKNQPAPGPGPAMMTASKGAVHLPSSVDGPALADPNARTALAEGHEELRNPQPPSGKSVKAPAASPPLALTETALPSIEELERLEESAKLKPAPDATPATRTNVPQRAATAPTVASPEPAPLVANAEDSLTALEAPRRRGPLYAAAGAGLVLVVAAAAVVMNPSTKPTTTPTPIAAVATTTAPAAVVPTPTPAPTPAPAPATTTPTTPTTTTTPTPTPPPPTPTPPPTTASPPAPVAPPPSPTTTTKAAKVVVKRVQKLLVQPKTRKAGYATIAGHRIELSADGSAFVYDVPEGVQSVKVEPYSGSPHMISVNVVQGQPLLINFE